jgi:hypothetical protein
MKRKIANRGHEQISVNPFIHEYLQRTFIRQIEPNEGSAGQKNRLYNSKIHHA